MFNLNLLLGNFCINRTISKQGSLFVPKQIIYVQLSKLVLWRAVLSQSVCLGIALCKFAYQLLKVLFFRLFRIYKFQYTGSFLKFIFY